MDKALEQELWQRYKFTGSVEARNRLIEAFEPMIHSVVASLSMRLPSVLEADDLESTGSLAVLNGIDSYDPAKGTRLSTWLYRRIRGALISALRRETRHRRRETTRAHPIEHLDDIRAVSRLVDRNGERMDYICRGLGGEEEMVVRLIFRYDLTVEMVAMLLEMHTSTVAYLYRKALATLRTLREEEWRKGEL